MPEEERRLSAILITDIVGYTLLGQTNEDLSLKLLEEHDALVRPLFSSHGGRVVKAMGDGFLVEFPSALQATRCAIAIQEALHTRNTSQPPSAGSGSGSGSMSGMSSTARATCSGMA